MFNRFGSEPAISRDISLLNQGGSQVLHGNLLTLPVGNSFLYIEPLYVQQSGTTGFPLLQAILVNYGDEIGYGSSVSDALTHLAPYGQVPPLRTSATGGVPPVSSTSPTPSPTSTSPTPSSSSPPSTPSGIDTVLRQLNDAFDRLQAAYKSGDLAAIGAAQADVQKYTSEYLNLRDKSSSTPTRSGSPSPTSTR